MHSVRSRPPARAGQKRPRSEKEAAEEDSGQDYEYDDNEWIGGGDDDQSEEGELRPRTPPPAGAQEVAVGQKLSVCSAR